MINEPQLPPTAENTMINPDINPCFDLGKELKTAELIDGYIGARNKPIKGKIYAASGALNQPASGFITTFFASGIAINIIHDDSIRQLIKT